MLRVRLKKRYLLAIGAVSLLYFVSWQFARGGIQYFSPYTLETYFQSEILLPLTEIPIYRSSADTSRYKLVQYLVDKSYWTPVESGDPPIITNHWNQQWRDGHSDIHRQFAGKADQWIEWSNGHPEIAAKLWSDVLILLRSDSHDSQSSVSQLMFWARDSETLEQYNHSIAADPELITATGIATK